jgi:hypothetical protein
MKSRKILPFLFLTVALTFLNWQSRKDVATDMTASVSIEGSSVKVFVENAVGTIDGVLFNSQNRYGLWEQSNEIEFINVFKGKYTLLLKDQSNNQFSTEIVIYN